MTFLVKHEIIHFFAALPVALFLLWKYKNPKLILFCYLTVFLVDLDHLADYLSYVGLNLWQNPIGIQFFKGSQKVIVPLHSWELVIALVLIYNRFKKPIILTISLALTSHFLVDQFSYNTQILSYSLIYRILNNFSISSFNHLKIPSFY